jgi:hypothetical protein
VREALNKILSFEESRWLTDLFTLGKALADIELPSEDDLPESAYDTELAIASIHDLVRFAVDGNSSAFFGRIDDLNENEHILLAAVNLRYERVVHWFARRRAKARTNTLAEFNGLLNAAGLTRSLSLRSEIERAGVPLSPLARAVVHHWCDSDKPKVWLDGNRVRKIGEEYAPPSAQPPEEGPAPTPDDEPIPAPEADDLQVRLGEAIAELGGGAPPVDTSMQDKPPEGVLLTLLSASDIADRVGRKRESVTSFLTRFAAKCPDCRVSTETKRKNEPSYLYRTADVWPALEQWLKDTNAD